MFKERCIQLNYLEGVLNRDVFLMCHNIQNGRASIDGTMIGVLRQVIRFSKKHKKAALIIQTPGGSLDETFYICKFFREYYDGVDTYIVGDCYSGGTIIALSSDNIYMNRNACLGPIDIQIRSKPDNYWAQGVYGMVNALEKGIKDGSVDPKMFQALEKREHILAMYLKLKYTYKNLVGEYVKKHCVEEENWENVWEHLAELNLSHGSPLTYKRCIELGLNVKRMPKKIDEIISKIVRDAEDEFGGLTETSIFADYYDSSDGGDVIRKSTISLNGKDGESNMVEVQINKAVERLAIIETAHTGYIQESEKAITIYGVEPCSVIPIKMGWKEEYNTTAVLPEQSAIFEEYIDECLEYSLEVAGIDGKTINNTSYQRLRNFMKESCYKVAISTLKEEGVDIDSMSSAEKWKAVVEYSLKEKEDLEDAETLRVIDMLQPFFRNAATECGIDYDALDKEAKIEFCMSVIEKMIPEVIEFLGVDKEEFSSFDKEEQYQLVIEYLCEKEEID